MSTDERPYAAVGAGLRRVITRTSDHPRDHGWRSAVPGVVCAGMLALLLRVPFVGRAPFPDEAGFLIVAREWNPGGPSLYGELWVDRPPLLLLFWRAADLLGGVEAARWMACLVVVAVVVAAGWSGWLVGARRGAHWAAFTAAGLVSTPLLATHSVNGELLAAPLVMLSCALTLTVVRRGLSPRSRATVALLAGTTAVGAMLIKQNFVDGVVFAAVLVGVAGVRGELSWSRAGRILGWGMLGCLLPLLVTVGWIASDGRDVADLWYVLYGFRVDAAQVIASQSLAAPADRLWRLALVALISGVLLVSFRYAAAFRRLVRGDIALSSAIAAMLGTGCLAVLAGGSYWLHYLIGLAPALALASAQLTLRTPIGPSSRLVMSSVVVSAIVAPVVAVSTGAFASGSTETSVTSYLRGAARDADTAVIAYGHANVLEEAGLRPGYRYLWSLPMRVRDPELNVLVSRLSGPARPTWFVEWEYINSWDIDGEGRLSRAVERNYREVASVCDVTIYLREGDDRTLPEPDPADCSE